MEGDTGEQLGKLLYTPPGAQLNSVCHSKLQPGPTAVAKPEGHARTQLGNTALDAQLNSVCHSKLQPGSTGVAGIIGLFRTFKLSNKLPSGVKPQLELIDDTVWINIDDSDYCSILITEAEPETTVTTSDAATDDDTAASYQTEDGDIPIRLVNVTPSQDLLAFPPFSDYGISVSNERTEFFLEPDNITFELSFFGGDHLYEEIVKVDYRYQTTHIFNRSLPPPLPPPLPQQPLSAEGDGWSSDELVSNQYWNLSNSDKLLLLKEYVKTRVEDEGERNILTIQLKHMRYHETVSDGEDNEDMLVQYENIAEWLYIRVSTQSLGLDSAPPDVVGARTITSLFPGEFKQEYNTFDCHKRVLKSTVWVIAWPASLWEEARALRSTSFFNNCTSAFHSLPVLPMRMYNEITCLCLGRSFLRLHSCVTLRPGLNWCHRYH
ncbi:hypothetical protein O3P69_006695 [Scylla paramamosain]|uniref:Uncharacterized protein n=1 Tax=Scylla paramamosain TaxID=85552 RepID=A0AAW0U0F9_SCYPA